MDVSVPDLPGKLAIVNGASDGIGPGLDATIDWDNLQGERSYSRSRSYGLSKLANVMFGLELDRRSQAGGWALSATSNTPVRP
ncbi:hypothetical protein DQ384_10910 [Sphaerisporangium album]|uniref:SDR family NAD(P)-dependent oxidoreductase n=1 Tax=Sphaerisporangium album TaxID=509200 RepID=A0A367FMV7_9ACTN|nr:hypothetical protein [Sphaerisporangium album]RCG31239.1 hypothetical protein DQ384_10910 [Sphaerisporangium album]